MKDRDSIVSAEPTGYSEHGKALSKRRHRDRPPHGEAATASPHVIARIPRLERNERRTTPETPLPNEEGRLVGRRLSTWTLVGGVAFLVVAAISLQKLFPTKNSTETTKQETAQRTDVPAPEALSAPRWNTASTASNALQPESGSSLSASANEFRPGMSPSQMAPLARDPNPAYSFAPVQQPVPGARSPDSLPGGALGSLPINQPRAAADSYRVPSQGGLVNAMPPVSATYPDYRNDLANPGYSDRGRPAGYEAGPTASRRPATGTLSARPADASRDWASPANWASSPPGESSPTVPPAAYALPPAQPSYPSTGYAAPDNWPSGDIAVAGPQDSVSAADSQAARFERTIETPTARTFNERTRSSFR